MARFLFFLILSLSIFGCNKLRNWKYNPPNVLLLSVKGLSRALPCYGDTTFQTPHIDRLAMRSVIFEEALAQHPTAAHALNSIYTGWYPRFFMTYPEDKTYLNSLFPALESGDYRIAFPGSAARQQEVHESVRLAHYVNKAEVDPPSATGHPAVTEQVLSLWSKYEGEPFFVNAHYRMKALEHNSSEAAYQEALAEVDVEIGRLLDELMERQEASNTIVILLGLNPMGVTPRHIDRSSFMPRFVKVPLLYYDFQQDSSQRVPGLTELRSLFPTLAERCLGKDSELHVCNAPSLQQILDGRVRKMEHGNAGLSNDTQYSAAYTSGLLYLSEFEGARELFSLSGAQAEQLPGDSILLDSLAVISNQKYLRSTAD